MGYQPFRAQGKRLIVCLHHSPFHVKASDQPKLGDKPDDRFDTESTLDGLVKDSGVLDDFAQILAIIHNGAAPGDPRQIDGLIYGHTTPDGVYQLPGEEGTATDLTDAQRQRLATNFKYYQDSYAKLVSCVNLEHATTKGQFGFPEPFWTLARISAQ